MDKITTHKSTKYTLSAAFSLVEIKILFHEIWHTAVSILKEYITIWKIIAYMTTNSHGKHQ